MNKSWTQSKTFWGCVLLFVAGGLEALGYSGAISTWAGIAGLPLTAFGLRDAMK